MSVPRGGGGGLIERGSYSRGVSQGNTVRHHTHNIADGQQFTN